jgi:hypothetical protein
LRRLCVAVAIIAAAGVAWFARTDSGLNRRTRYACNEKSGAPVSRRTFFWSFPPITEAAPTQSAGCAAQRFDARLANHGQAAD